MLNLGTATPGYLGSAQQTSADSGGGILGALGALFGGSSTPAYAGGGQPSAGGSGGLFGGGTPAYASAPPAPPPPPPPQTPATTDAIQCPVCPEIDPDPFGSGPIAIVIPRQS